MPPTATGEARAYPRPLPNPEWLDKLTEEILEPGLPIVDPHHHLWDHPGSHYLLDELLADMGSGHNIVATPVPRKCARSAKASSSGRLPRRAIGAAARPRFAPASPRGQPCSTHGKAALVDRQNPFLATGPVGYWPPGCPFSADDAIDQPLWPFECVSTWCGRPYQVRREDTASRKRNGGSRTKFLVPLRRRTPSASARSIGLGCGPPIITVIGASPVDPRPRPRRGRWFRLENRLGTWSRDSRLRLPRRALPAPGGRQLLCSRPSRRLEGRLLSDVAHDHLPRHADLVVVARLSGLGSTVTCWLTRPSVCRRRSRPTTTT